MEMKQYLVDTFRFNDYANKLVLGKIRQLPDKQESIRFFSHLINSQHKWLARIQQDSGAPGMSWWDPVYLPEELEDRWNQSLATWIDLLNSKTEDEIFADVSVMADNGTPYAIALKDIALQLNYHSIHHRAQIQMLIRKQGLTPDFVDYIGTKYKKII